MTTILYFPMISLKLRTLLYGICASYCIETSKVTVLNLRILIYLIRATYCFESALLTLLKLRKLLY